MAAVSIEQRIYIILIGHTETIFFFVERFPSPSIDDNAHETAPELSAAGETDGASG